jgi:WhiB family redox-sensing transcriptional regulator
VINIADDDYRSGLDEDDIADLAESLGFVDDDHDGLRWLADIACADVDPDDMFVEAGHAVDPALVEMCRGCPVRRECLVHSYRRPATHGYRAGLSSAQRRRMTLAEALEFIKNDPPRNA